MTCNWLGEMSHTAGANGSNRRQSRGMCRKRKQKAVEVDRAYGLSLLGGNETDRQGVVVLRVRVKGRV